MPKTQSRFRPYFALAAMICLHFIVMYALMYLMVHTWRDVFLNANNLYMSGAMAAPMATLMLLFMKRMYPDARLNAMIHLLSVILLLGFVGFTRYQTEIGDEQFLKSMIPHHSGAILMCEQASITDGEILSLCQRIKQSQQEEIDQMRSILTRRGWI